MTRAPVAVLGVSAHYHDSAAALVIDGNVVAAAQEERFTRMKGTAALPINAIDYVLAHAGLAPSDLAVVAFYESPFAKFDRILSTHLTGDIRALPRFVRAMRTWVPQKLWVEQQLRNVLGKVPVVFGDHHLSHAASAYHPSPFDDAAVLTIDGVGEWSTTTIGHGCGDALELLEHIEYPNSLGLLYSAVTLYCGFRVNSGEYKLMGLAPYGEPVFADRLLTDVIALNDDGSFALNPAYFDYVHRDRTYNDSFEALFGAPTRHPDAALTRHYANVAASIQMVLDTAMTGLASRAIATTGSKNLCLAGGVALNVVSVGHLERAGIADHIWVQPAAGDAGGSLGAALWASHTLLGVPRGVGGTRGPDGMSGALLGPTPAFRQPPTAEVLASYGLASVELDDATLAEAVASHLADGHIVGVARGRMEFGPRALGARSILADARDPRMHQRLNLATKFREGFRPFAPIVTVEDAEDWFAAAGHDSPYMLKTYPVRDIHRLEETDDNDVEDILSRARAARSTIPAVTHVDYSARVQTVDADRSPFLHSVLRAFAVRTGVPVLVNTSFNVRGEPIVCTATDAIEDFLSSDIDVLVVDNHVVVRSEQNDLPTPRHPRPRGED